MAEETGQPSSGLSGGFHLPTKMLESNLLSETAEAHQCFVEQKFSALLQAYIVDYVISISGQHSVYA